MILLCYVSFSDLNDIKYLNVLAENTEIKFDGSWLNGFINEMNSKEDLLNSLKAMPQNLRLNGKDWNGALIIHYWKLLNTHLPFI